MAAEERAAPCPPITTPAASADFWSGAGERGTITWRGSNREVNAMPSPPFSGHERRRHRVCVTRNTEYHLRDDVCVAVRDRGSGAFLPAHLAVGRRLSAVVEPSEGGPRRALGLPRPGDALFFGEGGRELVTSVVRSVDRASRDDVAGYRA